MATSLNGWAQSLFTNIFSFVNSSGVTQNVKQVSIEPLQAIGVYGDSVIVTNALIFTVKTNTLPVPLLNGYSYRVKYYASVSPEVIGSTFTNYFSTNVSGVVSAADYVTVTTNLGGGIYAYSMAAADARFAPIGGGSGGVTNGGGVLAGMLTNANFSATGTNAIQAIAGRAIAGSNYLTTTNLLNYRTTTWPNYASLTVTGCVSYPFLNGTNAWIPWSGSRSIFTKGNTNFLFFEAKAVKGSAPAWTFATVPALTNAETDTRILEFDLNGNQELPVNILNSSAYWTPDGATQDTLAIFAQEYSIATNIVAVQNGEINLPTVSIEVPGYALSVSNAAFNAPLFRITTGGALSGVIGGIAMFGVPFGQYVTNNQVGEVGFEAGKINYTATYNQKADARMGLDLGVYFNTDASGGSMIERMVQMPTYYGTANNGAGGWSRCFITHWKGSWIGDLPVIRHTYQDVPPARVTMVASTNDMPILTLTNQQPSGNRQFSGTLPPASFWTDNTNLFISGGLKIDGNPVLTNVPVTLSLAFGGMRSFNLNSSSSAYIYTSIFGGYDSSTAANHGMVIQPGTYTNFWGNHVYPAFTGTNFYLILTNNGSGTYVEAMRAYRINASANAQNLWSNTTTSFRVSVPTVAIIAMSNSLGTITAPFESWSIQKY